MKSAIKLIIADDQPLFSECLKIALNSESNGIDIVGIAKNGFEVMDFLRMGEADVILMDIRMPEMDGLETLKHISSNYPDVRVLMLTTFADTKYVQEALASGAKGYVLKDSNPKNLVKAIQMVLQDMMVFSGSAFDPADSATLSDLFFGTEQEVPEWYPGLTKREKEILYYLKKEFCNKEISLKMNLSEQTVKNYISTIYNKINVNSRKELRKCLK